MMSAGGIVLCNNNYTIVCTPDRPLGEVVLEAVRVYRRTYRAFNQKVKQAVETEAAANSRKLRRMTTRELVKRLKDPSLESMCGVLLGFVPLNVLPNIGGSVPAYTGEDPCMFVRHQEVARDSYKTGVFTVERNRVEWKNGEGTVPINSTTTMEDWYDLAKLDQRGCLKKRQFHARLDRVVPYSQAMGASLALAGKE
ncbi:MAG: hypothetical protein AABX70_03355 [Nanoarchaeota archaeon]